MKPIEAISKLGWFETDLIHAICIVGKTHTKMHLAMINNATRTGMLQFLCALLHVVLGASISDHHQHLRHVPPHATVWGEDLLIDVLQSNACMKDRRQRTRNLNTSSSLEQCDCYDATLPFSVLYLSWCFLLCSAQSAKLKSLCPCHGRCSAWTQSWRHHWTARMKPVQKGQKNL